MSANDSQRPLTIIVKHIYLWCPYSGLRWPKPNSFVIIETRRSVQGGDLGGAESEGGDLVDF
jgi:hypothetical protein